MPTLVIDSTASESSTEILARPPFSHSEECVWLPDEPECGSKSPIRFGSCNSTLDPAQSDHDSVARFGSGSNTVVDSLLYQDNDALSLQFARSPSPDGPFADG